MQEKEFEEFKEITVWLRRALFTDLFLQITFFFTILLKVLLAGSAAKLGESLQSLIYLTEVGVACIGFVIYLVWVYRANQNSHYFGAREMKFSPGWAVGCYFVPVLNLWMPFISMKEIWKTSKNPAAWQSQGFGDVLHWWWLFTIGMIIASIMIIVTFQDAVAGASVANGWWEILRHVCGITVLATTLEIVDTVSAVQNNSFSANNR